jgi:hypothetical protein
MRKFLALSCILTALLFCSVCTPGGSAPNVVSSSSLAQNDRGNPSVKVWVNTSSKVYHCPGTRWYGATKAGEYMTQKEAQDKGNRPAYGKYCQ